jgi:2-polyprenyl-6-methoxyphenol hydroxylase-like FAD-dependent oxidoreductase
MRAIICGAGIAGLTLAQRLTGLGWQVMVVEKAPGPRAQGYMMDFFGPGYDVAERIGLLPRLEELGYVVEEASYVNARGRRVAGLGFARFARATGGRLLSIMRPDLELALRELVADRVDLRYGCSVSEIHDGPDKVEVGLTDGSVHRADLLVGADGIHSRVRAMVFGPDRQFLRYLGFHTAAYSFEDSAAHRQVDERFVLTDTIDRQMGFYALRDERVAVFSVHRDPDPTLPADFRQALRETYAGSGWMAARALALCPPPSEVYYDQVAQVEMPRWSDGPVVLVGDAAGAVSLLAGQGASLAMAGAFVLAEQLARADSVGQALTDYQQDWRPVVVEKQAVARKGIRWFLPARRIDLLIRRVMLRLSGLPGVDRLIATSLAGKSGVSIQQLVHGSRTAPTGAHPVPHG